ncbi:hypothetical protein NBRC116588_13380 [Pyruvatibacter sp. HU-CL02332]
MNRWIATTYKGKSWGGQVQSALVPDIDFTSPACGEKRPVYAMDWPGSLPFLPDDTFQIR